MFSRFFIERPVLSNVLALVMILIGAVALLRLPVSQQITYGRVVCSFLAPRRSPYRGRLMAPLIAPR